MKAVASVTHQVRFRRPTGGARAEESTAERRTPRVARLLALAHHVDRKIREGELRDYAHAAKVLGLTRARISQIISLTLLAPEIQEAILDLPQVVGHDTVTERDLRPIVAEPLWERQVAAWSRLSPICRGHPEQQGCQS